MAINIAINNVAQGTGTFVKESVVEVQFTVSGMPSGDVCSVGAQFQLTTAHPVWSAAVLNPRATGTGYGTIGLVNGTYTLAIAVPDTLAAYGITAANFVSQLQVKLTATDTTANVSATSAASASITLNAAKPVVTTFTTTAQYIGAAGTPVPYTAMPFTLASSSGPSYYRMATSLTSIADNVAGATSTTDPTHFFAWTTGSTFAFPASASSGPQTIWVRAYDQYYNSSAAASCSLAGSGGATLPWLQMTGPTNVGVNLVGTQNNTTYTGITINGDGSFTPNRTVTAYVMALSPLPMTFTIASSSNVETAGNVGVSISYTSTNMTQSLNLTTNNLNPVADNYGADATCAVNVVVTDAAGNSTTGSGSMRLNTCIFQTSHTGLQPESPNYAPVLMEGTSVLPECPIISGNVVRAWSDIFYPASHSYPTLANGSLDTVTALSMAGVSNANYDAVLIGDGAIVYDSQGRPTMTDWTMDGTKNYGNMLSASTGSLTCWVLNNSQYGDFQLEFDYFDLDTETFGPPFNPIAPYPGDVLVVYDATAAGAVTTGVDPRTGLPTYAIADSTKLREIMAFTGSGSNVVNLTKGTSVNANAQGAFTSDLIQGIPLVVLILYTDAGGTGSGFHLKAGAQHQVQWTNFNMDYTNGSVWVHKHATFTSNNISGSAEPAIAKKMVYNYLDRQVSINPETGVVTFNSPVTGVVTADYTYYTGAAPSTTTFLASQDDFVNCMDVSLYQLATGTFVLTNTIRSQLYPALTSGKVLEHVTWDTDRGLVQFDSLTNVPTSGRLCADYAYHTFQRLTDDGYDDLLFNNAVVVADTTTAYPDFTYTDIKIINEGTASLENGQLLFVPRGIDTNSDGQVILQASEANGSTIVDQVLDPNRPWDIQMGTSAETCAVMACAVNSSYIWINPCPKSNGTDGNSGNSGAEQILGTWASGGTAWSIAPQGTLFGRVVWVLGGTGGTSYPATTAGAKRCSLEVQGSYFSDLIF